MFPDNWATVLLWVDLWPRWRMTADMDGTRRQALDLDQVRAALQLDGIPRREWRGIYAGLLEMESVALGALRKK
ncbi:MAG: DUF1799 domain-containing protein [Rhodocyclaceae bacterium]|nr:DUF1799 domain-containing protein [Rhodocyclaceae bacterium]